MADVFVIYAKARAFKVKAEDTNSSASQGRQYLKAKDKNDFSVI